MLRAMDSGEFRVLDALGEATLARTELVRRSGEPHSVLRALAKERAELFEEAGDRFRLSAAGRRALAESRRARALGAELSNEALVADLAELATGRGSIKRELDQVYATLPSVVRRARMLVSEGLAGERLLFLGDDDLASVATRRLLGAEARLEVLELDPELVALLSEAGVAVRAHDLREPLPKGLRGACGAVFTDPPYALEGFGLFVARAIEALRPEGVLYLAFGSSRRAPDRALAKQRLLAEAGLVIREVRRDFAEYEGAESIGSRSDLWVLRKTPQTRAPQVTAGELYTRRRPQKKKR